MTCCCIERDFCVQASETWHPTIRWSSGGLTTKPISGIAQSAPAQITSATHGVPAGWPVAVTGVQGMTQINCNSYPPAKDQFHYTTLVDINTLQLNDVSSADMSPYLSGGFLVYATPQDLSMVTASLVIYDNPNHTGTPLATLTDSGGGIALDNTLKTITPLLQTAGLTWTTGYYTLIATSTGSGVVTELMRGTLTIE